MRIAFTIFIGIHGIIHLFGFLKAFGLSEINGIEQPVSKSFGMLWLFAFLLFTLTVFLKVFQSEHWWIGGLLAVIVSQMLIFSFWHDAKFGTIPNIIILLLATIAFSTASFQDKIRKERIALFDKAQPFTPQVIQMDDIATLPPIVQKWLTFSGSIGKPNISNVHLVQELELKIKPEQTAWNKAKAEQYFTIDPPAFNWTMDTKMNSLLSLTARDKFVDGKGEMLIKLLSIFPVADVKGDKKIDQATLQRYLAEMVWFPSAALSSYIEWETVDENTAKATMEFKGTKGSGLFHFDDSGQFKEFIAMRYKDVADTEASKWIVRANKTEVINGIKIPTECEASWILNHEEWIWLKLRIKEIVYNTK